MVEGGTVVGFGSSSCGRFGILFACAYSFFDSLLLAQISEYVSHIEMDYRN